MPKPTRRQRRLGKFKPARRPIITPPTKSPEAEAEQISRSATSISPSEYDYVYQDLRRIAILAGLMFTALFILSFILK